VREGEGALAVLGLGSNRADPRWGDPRRILEEAVGVLGREILGGIRRAPLYKTGPLGPGDQPAFLNTAVAGTFPGTAWELLARAQEIEAAFGRDRPRERRWGERTLDIDILLFGGLALSDPPALEIPHPRLHERAFALVPLLELLPGAADPRSGRPYREILQALPPQEVVRSMDV
jgi:2-amino-4-hydroxy-6-hydroxymethyldihydropteridine diphosphokinase